MSPRSIGFAVLKGVMMKRPGWSFLLVNTNCLSRVRQVRLPAVLMILFVAVVISGSLGMIRLVSFAGSYTLAKFGVYEAQCENAGLVLKVKFLNRFIQKEAEHIESLIVFEDNARLNYGMNSISNDVRKAGIGGLPSQEQLMITSMMDPVVMKAEAVRESLSVLLRQAQLQDSTFSQMEKYVENLHKKWTERPSIMPTAGKVTSGFGYRFHPIYGCTMFHKGLDIANRIWTPVFATADGIVKQAGLNDYFGRMVILKHSQSGYETGYAHLQKAAVSEGQIVKRGELIGYLGTTGRSTGPHLHYEVYESGKPIDPEGFILPHDQIVD